MVKLATPQLSLVIGVPRSRPVAKHAPASVFAYLPFTLEWNLVAAVLLLNSLPP